MSEKKNLKSKKSKKIRWDYSGIPRKEWYWNCGNYNDYTAITTKTGLRYFVDDFWDSHGAGFQPYLEFLKELDKFIKILKPMKTSLNPIRRNQICWTFSTNTTKRLLLKN